MLRCRRSFRTVDGELTSYVSAVTHYARVDVSAVMDYHRTSWEMVVLKAHQMSEETAPLYLSINFTRAVFGDWKKVRVLWRVRGLRRLSPRGS